MLLRHEVSSASNNLNECNPGLQQDTSPTSTYSFLPDVDNPPYVSIPGFSPLSTELQEYRRDEKFSTGTAPQSYPESSQRTSIRDGPYSTGYDRGADGRYADIISAQGPSVMYENYVDPGLGQAASTRILLLTHRPSITERPDMYLFPVESSGMPSLRPPPGTTKSMFPEERLYSDTNSTSHPDSPPRPSSLEPQRLRLPTSFQMGRCSPDEFDASPIMFPNDDSQSAPYTHPGARALQLSSTTTHPPSTLSIPMRNNPGVWSSAPLGSATKAHSPTQHPSGKVLKRSSTRMTPDSDSPNPTGYSVSHVCHPIPDTPPSSSSTTSSSDPLTKKKKSKMHECEVCGKQFPRPSGLQTHMNTHNNVKPFSCVFPGCSRTFAVRSNATRHLRTHGTIPSHAGPPSSTYVVNFSAPTVMPSSTTSHEMAKAPYKLRWMPPSLMTRTNTKTLTSMSDTEYDSDDTMDVSEDVNWRSALSIPLRPVIPSSHTSDGNTFEERNSYLDAKPYPYHPSQYTVLPGPAVHRLTSAGHGVV